MSDIMREFDWETERDAEILKQYSNLKSNPERLANAKRYLEVEVRNARRALGRERMSDSHKNKATISRIEPSKYKC